MNILIGAGIAIAYTATVFFLGVSYEGRAGNIATLNTQIMNLRGQLAAHKAAAEADAQTLEAARPETERLEGVAREIASKISDGVCFGPDDVSLLRRLGPSISVAPTRPDPR